MWPLFCASALALDPPTPREPVDGEAVTSLSPTLVVDNPVETDLTLNFALYAGADGVDAIATRDGLRPGTDATEEGTSGWELAVTLDEDTVYSWVAWSEDSEGLSEASERAVFHTNSVNQAPSTPTASGPEHGLTWSSAPSLQTSTGADPDGDAVQLVFVVLDEDGALVEVITADSEADAPVSVTPTPLTGTRTCWYAYSLDELGARSESTETRCGWLEPDNQAPSQPAFTSVTDGAVLDTAPALTVDGCEDPEGHQVWLHFALDDGTTEAVLVGDAGPWNWEEVLADGTHTVSAWCEDGDASSLTSDVSLTVDATTHAPEAPQDLRPDGEALNDEATLAWSESEDLDGDALTYTVRVWDEGGWLLVEERNLTEATLSIEAEWTPGSYQWQVEATDAGGLTSDVSTASFEIASDTVTDTGALGSDGRSCSAAAIAPSGWLLLLGLLGLHRRRR